MIYYPLTVLMAAGIREICLISTPLDLPRFRQLLGDGTHWGIFIQYREQARPEGIGQAFSITEDFIGSDNVVLMLGDNIFPGGDDFPRSMAEFRGGATIFTYRVKNPERYGVVEFDRDGKALSIEEKPAAPRSNFAVPGIYIYDNRVLAIARTMRPSTRGELEITDINQAYMEQGQLRVHRLSRGFAWLDAGTSTSLQEASAYIEAIERRQRIKIGCPEEAALVRGFLNLVEFDALVQQMPARQYREYLAIVADETRKSRE